MFLTDDTCINYKLTLKSSIKDAIEVLEREELKIVLIIGRGNTLKGIVYDGDIRRALLKGLVLSDRVELAMVIDYFKVSNKASNEE